MDFDSWDQDNNRMKEVDFDKEVGNYKDKVLDRNNDYTKNFDYYW